MKADILTEALNDLEGSPLSSVELVQDYIQFRFDGSTLTSYTRPLIHLGVSTVRWGEPGYGDHLHAIVGSRLTRSYVTDKEVNLGFETGTRISISLKDEDYRGPEALELRRSPNGPWIVV